MKFIIIIVIVLVIIAAAQLMKVYELSSRLRNKDEADVTPAETKFNANAPYTTEITLTAKP